MVAKKTAGPGKAGFQSYIKLRPMKVFWHHHTHTTSTAQSE